MRCVFIAALLLMMPASSGAQVTVRAFADAGFTVFTATQSFKAVLGTPGGFIYGGGLEMDKDRLFLTVGAQRFSRSGHRVFVFQNQVFALDVKDTITVTPLDFTFGYRFRRRGLVPYAGGGIGLYQYRERSDHATAAENVQQSTAGYHALAGAELPVHRWIGVAFEAQWALVPNALGSSTSSVAKAFGEHDLGGFTVRTRVVVGR